MACDEADRPCTAALADAAKAFDQGMARAEDLIARLVIDTPDPYLNAGAPASMAAAAGLFVDPTFVHGGSQWRMRMPGWRTMGGPLTTAGSIKSAAPWHTGEAFR